MVHVCLFKHCITVLHACLCNLFTVDGTNFSKLEVIFCIRLSIDSILPSCVTEKCNLIEHSCICHSRLNHRLIKHFKLQCSKVHHIPLDCVNMEIKRRSALFYHIYDYLIQCRSQLDSFFVIY